MTIIKNLVKRIKKDRQLKRLLTGTKSLIFMNEELNHVGELRLDELKFLGHEHEVPTKVMKEELMAEYSNLVRVRAPNEKMANFAIRVYYNPERKSSIYRKFVKLGNGRWYTLNDYFFWEKVNITPEDTAEWLLFYC